MEVEKIARILDTNRVVIIGDKISILGIPQELAEELWKLIELLVPSKNCLGYAVVNGETIVFQKGFKNIIAFIDENRVIGALKRLGGNG
ncbi:MAG: hypothetical protein NZ872_03840 [Archaeoglobaceae archaeon]|nr:hypothetical protein [Archaeoglobaceae archaeon]MDW8128331.1 hypothetical protein [Archaeoglobaceae archaeon]